MPDERWRDELQEYALLVEAVANGDRSKVVKLFGDYILRKKAAETEAEAEAEAAAEQEGDGEEYDEGDHDPSGEYGEEYDAEEYDGYYQEDENGEEDYHQPARKKRVRFAEEEEGGYYDEEGNPAYGSQELEYNGEEDGFYGEDYNENEYDEGADGGPFMSGALPSENHDPNTYYQEDYGDGYGNYDGTGSYGQEDQHQNNTYSHDPEHQGQYEDYYGSSAEANGFGEQGYYDSTQDDAVYDYNMNQQNGGEWNKAFHENERVTDDEVQDYGFNSNADELDRRYPKDITLPQEGELNDFLQRLQQGTVDHEFDETYVEEDGDSFLTRRYHDEDEDGEEADDDGLEEELQNGAFGGSRHMHSNLEDDNASRQAPYPEDEESVYDDDDVDEVDFWDEDPADEGNIQGYSEDLDQLHRQFWAGEPDTGDLYRGNMAPQDEGFEDDDEEDLPQQEVEEDGLWDNRVRPHYDDVIPFPSFHRTISNERVLPYAIIPGDRFDESIKRDPMKEVNPQYNVFDGGQRFYDHYSGSCEDTKVDSRRGNQRGNLHPMSLVDKFRERLYAS